MSIRMSLPLVVSEPGAGHAPVRAGPARVAGGRPDFDIAIPAARVPGR